MTPSGGYSAYGYDTSNIQLNAPDMTAVKQSLTDGAAKLGGKVCSQLIPLL